jgi:hypothetical protein
MPSYEVTRGFLLKMEEEHIEDHYPSLPLPFPPMCTSDEYSHQQFALEHPQPDVVPQSGGRSCTLA